MAGLIAAINTVNGNGGADTINLAAGGTYTLTTADNTGYYGATGLPVIVSPITINGNGATIRRSSAPGTPDFRIFLVSNGPSRLVLNSLTIRGGKGIADGWGGNGLLNTGIARLENCTVTENSGGDGGGILNYCGTLTVLNSTISYNTAFGRRGGGGIWNFSSYCNSTVVLINSTIFENVAAGDADGNFNGRGNALSDSFSSSGSIVIKNSILASPSQAGFGYDLSIAPAVVTSFGHNIVGDTSGGLTAIGDLNSTNPLLGLLADNGGPAWTHAPLPGSPAIDAEPLADTTDGSGNPLTTDQRGVARPQGALSDIGAVEVAPNPTIRVAVFQNPFRTPADAGGHVVNQLNDSTLFQFNAVFIEQPADLLAQLSSFDVVVMGDDGRGESLFSMNAVATPLRAWVQGGGRVVLTGWGANIIAYNYPDFQAILPVSHNTNLSSVTALTVTSATGITGGVRSFDYLNWLNWGVPKPGATVLGIVGSNAGQGAIVTWQVGLGTATYLAPIYMGSRSDYGPTLDTLRSGAPDRLLEQAVANAAGPLDVTPPVLNGVPSNIIVQATGPTGAVVSYATPTANDLVDGARPVVCAPPSGATFPIGTTVVSCTASDTNGNTASASFTVTVLPGLAPAITSADSTEFVLSAPGSFTVTTTGLPTPTLSQTGNLPGGVTFDAGTGVLSGTPTSAGIYNLTFTASNGVSSNAVQNFTLNVIPLQSIEVTPGNSELAKGMTSQFFATGVYGAAITRDLSDVVNWNSSKVGQATISTSGLVTAVGHGAVVITANLGTISGSTPLTVTPPALVSIAVKPSNSTLETGSKKQLGAIGTYSDGSAKTLTTSVTWTSSNPSSATISSGGLVTGGLPGSSTIQAEIGTISGLAMLTVQPVLVSISIAPLNSSIARSATLQFTAIGHYSDNSSQNVTGSVAWESSQTKVATISTAGLAVGTLAAGAKAGTTTIKAKLSGVTATTVLTVTP